MNDRAPAACSSEPRCEIPVPTSRSNVRSLPRRTILRVRPVLLTGRHHKHLRIRSSTASKSAPTFPRQNAVTNVHSPPATRTSHYRNDTQPDRRGVCRRRFRFRRAPRRARRVDFKGSEAVERDRRPRRRERPLILPFSVSSRRSRNAWAPLLAHAAPRRLSGRRPAASATARRRMSSASRRSTSARYQGHFHFQNQIGTTTSAGQPWEGADRRMRVADDLVPRHRRSKHQPASGR